MTQVWDDDNRVVPVTVLRVRPNRIVRVKTVAHDGYSAVQVTFGERESHKLSRPQEGHFNAAGVDPGIGLVELRLDDVEGYEGGQELTVGALADEGRVDVTAVSKGKGFAGGVKRHGFRGGPKTHGQSDRHRAPGSIGAGSTPGRVIKGLKMAGHLGDSRVTVRNLEVVRSDSEKHVLFVKGSVPGSRNSLVLISKTNRKGHSG